MKSISPGILENSQCKLYCKDTTIIKSGNDLTVNWYMQFNKAMAGKNCGIWLRAVDKAGLTDGWDQKGSVKIDHAPINVSLSPSSGTYGIGTKYSLKSTHADADGYADISQCYLLINSSLNGGNSVYYRYDASTNKLYVRNNANTSWVGGYAPGSSNTIENSYCKLHCKDTTVSKSGNNVAVNWKVEVKSSMSQKSCGGWIKVSDDVGMYTIWEKKGSYSIK